MKLDKLVDIYEKNGPCDFVADCEDCKKETIVSVNMTEDGNLHITGGAVFEPPLSWLNNKEKFLVKCDECFKKDNIFHPRTEVYSRCVGYLRPVEQWNPGKTQEFKTRKMYDLNAISKLDSIPATI